MANTLTTDKAKHVLKSAYDLSDDLLDMVIHNSETIERELGEKGIDRSAYKDKEKLFDSVTDKSSPLARKSEHTLCRLFQ